MCMYIVWFSEERAREDVDGLYDSKSASSPASLGMVDPSRCGSIASENLSAGLMCIK